MGLVKKRPMLMFSALSEYAPGETLVGELLVKADEAVPLDWLKVTFHGGEWAGQGSGKSRRTSKRNVCNFYAVLAEKHTLQVGSHRFGFSIPLPADLPPTYRATNAKTTYSLQARASIPWWPDAKVRDELRVCAPPPRVPHPGQPMILATSPSGPSGTEAYAEVSFSQRVFAPGDVVRGAVALRNVAHQRYRKLVIRLRSNQTTLIGRHRRESHPETIMFEVDISKLEENQQLPFSFQLSSHLSPTFHSHLWQVTWSLQVELDIAWQRDPELSVDVDVTESRYAKANSARKAPVVGEQRLEACWQEVATARGLEIIGSAIGGRKGSTTISVWREQTDRGPVIVGKVAYPSLGLGLELEPAGGFFSGAGRRGVLIDERGWDKNHEVEARDLVQATSFLTPLKPELLKLAGLRMSDSQLEIRRPGAGNQAADLDSFVAPLKSIAHKIEAARAHIAPPASVEKLLPAWRQLADAVDGEMNSANLSISGRFAGHPITIAAAWSADGDPTEIVVGLELLRDLDPSLAIELTPTLLPDLPDGFPGPAKDLVESLAGLASRLEIGGDAITAACEWLADPRHAQGVLRTLTELAAVLQPGSGPFR